MHEMLNKPQCPNSSVCEKFLLSFHSQYSSHLSFPLTYLWEHLLDLEAVHLLGTDISLIYKTIKLISKLILNNEAMKIQQIATLTHAMQICGVTYMQNAYQTQNARSLLHLKL
jgi:hypothetical protein